MKVAIIQLNSTNDKNHNLLQVKQVVSEACAAYRPALIALPEMFTLMGGNQQQKHAAAEIIQDDGPAISLLKKLAQKYQVFIHGGSMGELFEGKLFNTTCVINPSGEIISIYRKINLFNFTTLNTQYNESKLYSAGDEVKTYSLGEHTVGCAICFDLRFGKLFQTFIQKKVDIIIAPSAFTYETGKAHWEILCRSRAIETQSYLIAPAQTGNYLENNQERSCFGHSMIVDPWGNILAMLEEKIGFASAELDFDFLQKVRTKLPLIK